MAKKPSFGTKKELARHIRDDDRRAGNRPGIAAFLPLVGESYLSVNSTELETLDEISRYYRIELQGNRPGVAISVHKVVKYNDSGRKAGVAIVFDKAAARWDYLDSTGTKKPAYKHRAVSARAGRLGSSSHCGVEFVDVFDKHDAIKFARRMALGQKFHLK